MTMRAKQQFDIGSSMFSLYEKYMIGGAVGRMFVERCRNFKYP